MFHLTLRSENIFKLIDFENLLDHQIFQFCKSESNS